MILLGELLLDREQSNLGMGLTPLTIAVHYIARIRAGGGGDHVRANPKTDGIDRARCHASRLGHGPRSADEYRTRGCLSYCTEFSRAGREPLVLSHGSGEPAQVLVHTRVGSARATRSRPGFLRLDGDHTHRCIEKACNRLTKRTDVNKPWRRRCSAPAARQATACV